MASAKSSFVSYAASAEMKLEYKNNILNFNTGISYFHIDYQYTSNVLPIIYVSLSVSVSEYNILNKYRDSGKIFLVIKRYPINSKSAISKVILSDHFNYMMVPVGAAKGDNLNKNNDSAYINIMLGLISATQQDLVRQSFNGIYKNISTSTLVANGLAGMNPIIEKISNNITYDNIIIPPITGVKQYLNFLNNKNPFYSTGFIFFLDFDHAYLLSKNGKAVSAGDNNPSKILFNIEDVDITSSYTEGMNITKSAYEIFINPKNVSITNDEITGKKTNKIIAVSENNKSNMDLELSGEISSTEKSIFVRSNDSSVIKNETEYGSAMIEIGKTFVDCSIYTPNKTYSIKNFNKNSIYNGNYILAYRKDVFTLTGNDYNIHTVLGLVKIGKLGELDGESSFTKSSNTAVKSSSVKTSTANKKASANSRLAK